MSPLPVEGAAASGCFFFSSNKICSPVMTKRRARVCSVTKRDHAGAMGGQTEFSPCFLLVVRTSGSRHLPTFNVCDSGHVRKALFSSFSAFLFFLASHNTDCRVWHSQGGRRVSPSDHCNRRRVKQRRSNLTCEDGRTDGQTGSD